MILGLLLAIPIAMLTSASRPGALLTTPEEVAPPLELTRANELFAAAPDSVTSAIQLLRSDEALLEAHLATLPITSTRTRGQVDPDLAIARQNRGRRIRQRSYKLSYAERNLCCAVQPNAALPTD